MKILVRATGYVLIISHFALTIPIARADPERLPGITVTGSYSPENWGVTYGYGSDTSPHPPSPDQPAPEPEPATGLIVSNKTTDVRCSNVNSNGLDAVTSRDDATARELAANSAANRLKAAYAARSIAASVLSWLDGNGGFKAGDDFVVTFADGGTATYTIENPSAGSNTLAPGSEKKLVQGDGVVKPPAVCAA